MKTAPEEPADLAASAPGPAPAGPKLEEIPLETPIQRGTTTISTVHLRKPGAGEMRGLQLQALQQGDVNNILALLPRITVPPLSQQECEKLEPVDLAAMTGTVQSFFMSQMDRALLAKVMGAIEQETSTS